MAYYRSLGSIPPKRHTQHRAANGQLLFEELIGEEGFSSDSALLYHQALPSAIVASTVWTLPDQELLSNHPLKPRHFRLHELTAGGGGDVVTGRRLILGNSEVRLSYVQGTGASPLYRNAVGDECVFVESGHAEVETMLGSLPVAAGDYVIVPRGLTHRWCVLGAAPLQALAIEASSHIGPANRYLSRFGQLLEHAPYCERDLHGPDEVLLAAGADVEVLVKHRSPGGVVGTRLVYAQHPFDVVGWDGCLYPYRFNVSDFEPITGRVHQPPPAHQVFEGEGFVICNFVPRKVDYHPRSIPIPYYHSNVDSDEVILYVAGNYAARRGSGIGPGSVSLHPAGHSHGPAPGAYEASIGTETVDEVAVMVDTFRPLLLGEGGRASDDGTYAWSWVERSGE